MGSEEHVYPIQENYILKTKYVSEHIILKPQPFKFTLNASYFSQESHTKQADEFVEEAFPPPWLVWAVSNDFVGHLGKKISKERKIGMFFKWVPLQVCAASKLLKNDFSSFAPIGW